MIRKFIAAFIIIFFSAATAFAAEEEHPSIFVSFEGVTAEFKYGNFGYPNIVQEKDILFARGEALGPSNWDKRDSFYKTFARQAARMTALRNLAEQMSDILRNIDQIRTEMIHDKVFKLLEKNARQVGNAIFDEEGICTIYMAVRIPSHK